MTRRPVTVIGGANVDVKLTLDAPPAAGTSNPGHQATSLGGVARNIAENLARLQVPTRLISAVGRDAHGDTLLTAAEALGIDVSATLWAAENTGSYTAVLAPDGELVIAVAAMQVMGHLNAPALQARRALIEDSALIIVDGNLGLDALAFVAELAAEQDIPLMLEPVSVAKAAAVRPLLQPGLKVHTLTPNRAELAALVGRSLSSEGDLLIAARELHHRGVQRVWIRLGAQGSLLCTAQDSEWLPALPARVTDVTGAGDAMLAAYVSALLSGYGEVESARVGHAAAALTVESAHTVLPDLTPEALRARLKGN